jgi:hypothetical protein
VIVPSLVSVAFVVDREAMGQVLRFSPVIVIPPVLYNQYFIDLLSTLCGLPVDGVHKTTRLKLASPLQLSLYSYHPVVAMNIVN